MLAATGTALGALACGGCDTEPPTSTTELSIASSAGLAIVYGGSSSSQQSRQSDAADGRTAAPVRDATIDDEGNLATCI